MARATSRKIFAAVLPLAIAAALSGCGGGGSSSSTGTGTMNLSITDAPVDDADQVIVEFTGVEIKPSGGSSFSIDFDAPRQIDLLAYTGGIAADLLNGETLAAGDYEWIRLKVNASQGGDPADDSYIVIGGVPHELRIPSGQESGLKLNRPITIPADGSTSFTIDFDLRKSVHERAGGIYNLRPTLRLVDDFDQGTLRGDVSSLTMGSCAPGTTPAVYVFEGPGAPPDDVNIDGSDDDPEATAHVETVPDPNNPGLSIYRYTVAFLEAGPYTAAFTCDAGSDDPSAEDTLTFVGTTDVTITAGQTTTQNF